MSNDDEAESVGSQTNDSRPPRPAPKSTSRSFFSIPPPIKRIFDRFPLITYEENTLPLRAPVSTDKNVLYIFATEQGACEGRPSFNPTCLKWQTCLKFCNVPFTTRASSNHASPSGVLPFLLPARQVVNANEQQEAIPSKKLPKWISTHSAVDRSDPPPDARYDAYMSLIDHRIRKAWLYQLYLSQPSSAVRRSLYVSPCSTNPLVQLAIDRQLYAAAISEIVKASTCNTIDEAELMTAASEAFAALSDQLGDNEWFFGVDQPGIFDASVFAYTHLILDPSLGWKSNILAELLGDFGTLVSHRQRILDLYY